jgi:hypothetical protein
MVKKADNRRSMAVMAAWLVTTGIGVTAYAAAMSQADEPDATAAPAYVQTVGDGIAPDPSSSGAKALRALERTHGVRLTISAPRVVRAPASAGQGEKPWTVAATADGGVCAAASGVVFCGLNGSDVSTGEASATKYPADQLVSIDTKRGTFLSKPSEAAGVRVGIAPPNTAQIVVFDGHGGELEAAEVDRGLYEVKVPRQGSGGRVEFRDARSAIIAVRPAEG